MARFAVTLGNYLIRSILGPLALRYIGYTRLATTVMSDESTTLVLVTRQYTVLDHVHE